MKKFLRIITTLIIVPSLFAAGGNDANEYDLYEILWYNIGTPQKDTEKVFEELSKYTAEKIGATVKMQQFDWGEYNEKMKVIIASGEPYDIGFTSSWANHYAPNVAKGAFLPLTDLLNEYGQETLKVINPAFFEGIRIDNEIYAIPANKELGWWEVWLFNEEIVNKYGFDISSVRDIADLAPMLERVKASEGADFTPIMADSQFSIDIHQYAWVLDSGQPFVVDFENSDFKVKNIYETPEMMANLNVLFDYYNKGFFRKDVATLKNTEELRKSGKWFVTKAHFQPYADKLLGRDWETKLVYSPSYTPYADNSSTQGSMQAISITSGNPEKAMAFLNLMNTDPYVRNLVGVGIEGIHWEMNENGKIANLEASQDYKVPGFTLQNLFITYLYEDDPDDKWVKFQEFNDSSRPSPMLGFQADMDPIKSELAAMMNVNEEFRTFLNTGSIDPAEFVPKYLGRLNAVGAEKVREELQRQVDAWRSNKK